MAFPLLPVAAVAAIAAYALSRDKSKLPNLTPADPRTKPQTPPIQNEPGQPRVSSEPTSGPMPQSVEIGKTPLGNPINVITPIDASTGKATVVSQVATHGNAVLPARALYDYLKTFGTKAGPELGVLVTTFQNAHNGDGVAVRTAGMLPTSGQYDLPTSGALTVYTGNPIPPNVDTPMVSAGGNNPGTAAITGSNLYAYLKQHPITDGDATLTTLVSLFQKAVNTDEKYPGPASPFANARIIKEKLTVDGKYGPKTSDALAVITLERINPNGKPSPNAAPSAPVDMNAALKLAEYIATRGSMSTVAAKALVAAFQTFANVSGLINPKLVVDGVWGPKSQAALKRFT